MSSDQRSDDAGADISLPASEDGDFSSPYRKEDIDMIDGEEGVIELIGDATDAEDPVEKRPAKRTKRNTGGANDDAGKTTDDDGKDNDGNDTGDDDVTDMQIRPGHSLEGPPDSAYLPARSAPASTVRVRRRAGTVH